jgi:hypothetical protein
MIINVKCSTQIYHHSSNGRHLEKKTRALHPTRHPPPAQKDRRWHLQMNSIVYHFALLQWVANVTGILCPSAQKAVLYRTIGQRK